MSRFAGHLVRGCDLRPQKLHFALVVPLKGGRCVPGFVDDIVEVAQFVSATATTDASGDLKDFEKSVESSIALAKETQLSISSLESSSSNNRARIVSERSPAIRASRAK